MSQVYDEPEGCPIDLFCDAELAGCPLTAKSTSGLYLVIRGDKGTFCPIAWGSRRQTHVARSTADVELNSIAEGLHEELLPSYQLLVHLLGKRAPKPVAREDNTAVVQSIGKGYNFKLWHLAGTPKLSRAYSRIIERSVFIMVQTCSNPNCRTTRRFLHKITTSR